MSKKSSTFAPEILTIVLMKRVSLFSLPLLFAAAFLTAMPAFAAPYPQSSGDDTPVIVEKMPSFPGGQKALFEYLDQNITYPKDALDDHISGRIVCRFIVNTDGSISDVQVVRSLGYPSLDQEAVRVVSNMPNWIPGSQHGEPIRVKYTLPINFHLPN